MELAKVLFVGAFVALVVRRVFGRRTRFIESLAGKHVFITGASSGIGLAVAKKALSEGAYVTLVARSSEKLKKAINKLTDENICSDIAGKSLIKVADVCSYGAIALAIQESFMWRPIDILVCNAGLTRGGLLETLSVADIDITVRTNVLGVVYTVHAALPLMKQRCSNDRMAIVFISSLASLFLMYGNAVYSGTKYALRGIAECLRLELLPFDNIRVNMICPGFVETAFLDEAEKKHEIQAMMKEVSLYNRKRAQTSDFVASCTLKAVKQGRFIVTTTPIIGPALLLLARGWIPADSFLEFMHDLVLCIPVRLVSLVFKLSMYRKIIADNRNHPVP